MQEILGRPKQIVKVIFALLIFATAGVALPMTLEARLPYYATQLTVALMAGGVALLALIDTFWGFSVLFLGWSLFNSQNFPYFQYSSKALWLNLFVLGVVVLTILQITKAIVRRTALNYKLSYWDIALSLFFLMSLFGITVAQNIPLTLSLSIQFLLSALLTHHLVEREIGAEARLHRLLWLIAAGCTLVAAIAIVEAFLLSRPLISYLPGFALNRWQQAGFYSFSGEPPHRAWSTLGNPIPSGAYLAMFLPLVLFLAETSRGMQKTLAGIVGVLVVFGILVTVARGAALAGGMVLVIWYLTGTVQQRGRTILGTAGIFLALSLIFLIPNPLGGALSSRFTQEEIYNINLYHRINSFATVGNVLKGSPLLGIGFGRLAILYQQFQAPGTELIYTTDNYFLRVLAETGIPATVFLVSGFLWLLLYFLRRYLSLAEPYAKRLTLAILLGVVVLILQSFTFDILGSPNLALSFFTLMGIGFAAISREPRRSDKQKEPPHHARAM